MTEYNKKITTSQMMMSLTLGGIRFLTTWARAPLVCTRLERDY
jgi:hypothetical protein